MNLYRWTTPSLAPFGKQAIATIANTPDAGRLSASAAVYHELGKLDQEVAAALMRDLEAAPERITSGGILIAATQP